MTFSTPDAGAARAERAFAALTRLAERHAATPEARARQVNAHLASPAEAVRVTTMLAGGGATYLEEEPAVDGADLVAALTLLPLVRAELDQLELALLTVARAQGLTWSEVAFGLGLASAQAAQQRFHRLESRAAEEHAPGAEAGRD